jgi:predicted TIM-barrel fold metal-dependent hydrolase
MARTHDIPVFDADNHFYETRESFTRHLPREYDGAIRYVEVDGRTKIVVRNVISDYVPNPTFDVVARPGAQEEYFRSGNPDGKSFREVVGEPMRSIPAFRDPAERIKVMDELGLDQTLMFPTLASLLEERMRDDAELTSAAVHALNRWILDDWTFNYQDRIFAVPIVTLPILDKAIAELDWCLEHGARTILVRPAPVAVPGGSRSFALPHFDPFWQRVVDADIPVTFHSSDSGYSRYQADWTGPEEYLPFRMDAFRMMTLHHRAIQDAVSSMTCHGLLTRFPDLKVMLIENGAEWVPPLLHNLEDTYRKVPQLFDEDPIEAFKRNVYIAPFHEDDVAGLAEIMGTSHILFGSDWPHPEGLAEPRSYIERLAASFPEPDVAAIMGGNVARLTGIAGARV